MFGKKSLKLMAESVVSVAKSETTKKIGKGVLIAGATIIVGSVLSNKLGDDIVDAGIGATAGIGADLLSSTKIGGFLSIASKFI